VSAGRLGRWCGCGAALAFGLATLFVPVGGAGLLTSYAAVSPATRAAFLIAGLGLVLAGALVAAGPATCSLSLLGAAAGVTWLAPVWIGWQHGPPLVRSVAMVLAWFLPAVLLHLAVSAPSGRLIGAARRRTVAIGYLVTVVAATVYAVTRDPFLDPDCWSNCTDNVFVVLPDPVAARWIGIYWHWTVLVGGMVAAAVAVRALAVASPVARSTGWPVLVTAFLANIAEAVHAAALLGQPAESPGSAAFLAIFYLRATTLTLVAVALVWVLLEQRHRRSAVARLADDLAAAPAVGALQSSLARSLGDKYLTVAYWLPDSGEFVDAAGRRVDPRTDPNRASTSIVRGGSPVAVINHDRALYGDQELAAQIGPAARLAIDNERLMARVLAQLEALRAARGRIVEAADDTRRRIERDLHDGAQQRLLAVTFELRLARSTGTDQGRNAALDVALAQATAALADLRDIAHGIFPAILDESGLAAAVWTLTDRAEVPVELTCLPDERLLPAATERAAYLTVVEVLTAAGPADDLTIAIRRSNHALIVDIDGVAVACPVRLEDLVGAAGGILHLENRHLRAELPCE
jgi:signal transduction histidine kinase